MDELIRWLEQQIRETESILSRNQQMGFERSVDLNRAWAAAFQMCLDKARRMAASDAERPIP